MVVPIRADLAQGRQKDNETTGQSITSQNCNRPSYSLPRDSPGFVKTIVGPDGSSLKVTCTCPIKPNGVKVLSELGIEGQLEAKGSLPFISTMKLEGTLPSSGQASVSYACGDGNVAIVEEAGNPCGSNARVEGGVSFSDLARVRQITDMRVV
ncbi:hypothetical protein MSG28_014985 [Choristoneura fumiferana]|uniref:Uncharacterized protein n=1 Tax=Choristoneura fumiferana TaxID=7141 RepID=A0ACC0KYF7_CHOFU|nr:hypothetical protein MSG28_014985 [Choristoneura fumiferana]